MSKRSLDIFKNVVEQEFIEKIENAKKDVRDIMLTTREEYAGDYEKLIQLVISRLAIEFSEMYPGAQGFIEGRIKAPNSILLKLKNKFQNAMNETDLDKQLGKIKSIDLTDILACSIVVTVPPKKFKTTDDKLNEKLNELAIELEITEKRISENKKIIEDKEEQLTKLNNEIEALKQEITEIKKNGTLPRIEEMLETSEGDDESKRIARELLCKLLLEADQKREDLLVSYAEEVKNDIKNGQKNLSRTIERYDKELLEIQREMAYAFVSNIANLQTFKTLNTNMIEAPELKNKPGFVATTAKYRLSFTNKVTKEPYGITIEIQGKGENDWKVAEFGNGALYHENQKTDEGQYSKQTNLPDFTIIGKSATDDIEKAIRSKYDEKLKFESLLKMKAEQRMQWYEDNNLDSELIEEECKKLKKYVDRVQDKKEKAQDKITLVVNGEEKEVQRDSDEYQRYTSILEKTAEEKIAEAIRTTKEHIIQSEIEREINKIIDVKADEAGLKKVVENGKNPLSKVYQKEIERLKNLKGDDISQTDEEIKHEARVKVLYYLKEQEIREITKDIVPIFFYSNISDNKEENQVVCYRSTGEAIYRYYYNRLHGLEDSNIMPQEQQKKALLKLTGLFNEDSDNFFVYDRTKNERVNLEQEQEQEQEK